MNHKQFYELLEKAKKPLDPPCEDLGREAGEAGEIIHNNVHPILTERAAIALIKWQCSLLFGGWDSEAVNETQVWFRKVRVIS